MPSSFLHGEEGTNAFETKTAPTMDELQWTLIGTALGFVTGLMARPLNRALDRRYDTRTSARAERLRKEVARDRQRLRDFLTLQILETTVVGALTSILTALTFVLAPVFDSPKGFQIAGQLVLLVGGVLILRIAGDAISVARSVRSPTEPDGHASSRYAAAVRSAPSGWVVAFRNGP